MEEKNSNKYAVIKADILQTLHKIFGKNNTKLLLMALDK